MHPLLYLAPPLLVVSFARFVPQDPARQPEVLQRADRVAAVTDAHRRLGRLVGSWTIELRNTPPKSAEQTGRGTVEATSILGGRWIQLEYRFELQGRPVQAMQLLGFDELRQLYTASWRDDLSTWAVDCAGVPLEPSPDVLRMHGSLADARDPTGRPFRLELDLSSKDAVSARVFDSEDGEEFLLQTQTWARR